MLNCDSCENEVDWTDDEGLCEECHNAAGINRMEALNDRD